MRVKLFRQNEFIVLLVLVLVKLVIHLLTNAFAGYGIYRDELYYIACSNHLDLGYVDHPPLSIYLLALGRSIFGDSIFAIRILPALAGAITVLITGLIIRKLKGGIYAIIIGGLTIVAVPVYLGWHSVYSMNSYDMMFWALAAYLLVLIIKEKKIKFWIPLGLILGLGMLNKISMTWFAIGLISGMLLTRQRYTFLTKWPYYAAGFASILFFPYILWNILHDFAHLEFIHRATTLKYASVTRGDFVVGQALVMNPVTLPVSFAGLYYYFFNSEGKSLNILGIIFIVSFAILLINGHSKAEYLAAAYPMIFAAGGVQLELLVRKKLWRWLKYLLPVFLFTGGLIISPITLPFLPVENFIQYSKTLGLKEKSMEGREEAELTQYYADRFGWEELAETVSQVYVSLSEEEKLKTLVYAENYGQAGAIEYFSDQYNLPSVVSSHNNYWIWGLEHTDMEYQVLIIIGGRMEDHFSTFEEVEEAAIKKCRYCMPYENNVPIFIGKKFKRSLEDILKSNKNYN